LVESAAFRYALEGLARRRIYRSERPSADGEK